MKKNKQISIRDTEAGVLREGLKAPFWAILKRILESERHAINAKILELGMDTDNMKMVSDLIKMHDLWGYVVALPEICIEEFETADVNDDASKEEQDENDPYENEPLAEVRNKIIKGKNGTN